MDIESHVYNKYGYRISITDQKGIEQTIPVRGVELSTWCVAGAVNK